MYSFRISASRALLLVASVVGISACETRLDFTSASIRRPAITAPIGTYQLRSVDDAPLPHSTTGFGTVYTLVTGSFDLGKDSTWAYHSVTAVTAPDGTPLGTSPANYGGRWTATDTTIELLAPASGSIKIRGDTLYWIGGPKFDWEQPLKFGMTK